MNRADRQIMAYGVISALGIRLLHHIGFLQSSKKNQAGIQRPLEGTQTMETQNNQPENAEQPSRFKRFFTRKVSVVSLMVMLLVSFVLGAVAVHKFQLTTTVDEALSSANTDVVASAFPGEIKTHTVTITNDANVDLNAALSWVETANSASVAYTTDMPKTVVVPAGTTTDFDVAFSYADDSPVGDVVGTVSIARTA